MIDEPRMRKQHRDFVPLRNIALSFTGRDLGELPAVVNVGWKARTASNFHFFCESYCRL